MSNVIQFPSKRTHIPVDELTEEDVLSNVDNIKYNHINETINAVVPMLFHNMELAGFEFELDDSEPDIFVKDGSFLVESIRSMLCKFYEIEHPFQFIADNIFVSDGEGNFSLAKKLELNLESFKVEEEDSES
jgi:hypothetical protein